MEESIRKKMEQAVKEHCKCPFSSSAIYSEEINCPFGAEYGLASHVTYHAILNGTSDLLPASTALEHIQDWVDSEGSFRYNHYRLRMTSTNMCKLSINSFKEEECS